MSLVRYDHIAKVITSIYSMQANPIHSLNYLLSHCVATLMNEQRAMPHDEGGFNIKTSSWQHRNHDDVIKWRHFPRYWPFVRGIHRPPVNSPHKGQWRGALILSLIFVWIYGWVNNRDAGEFRRHRAHYDLIVMISIINERRLHDSLIFIMKISITERRSLLYWNRAQGQVAM